MEREGNPLLELKMAGHEGWLSNGTARPRYGKNNSRGAGRMEPLVVEAAIGLAVSQVQPHLVFAAFR